MKRCPLKVPPGARGFPLRYATVCNISKIKKLKQKNSSISGGRNRNYRLEIIELQRPEAHWFVFNCPSSISIALFFSVTICTAMTSSSALWKVKTWLPSARSDERFSSICVMNFHRGMISKDKKGSTEGVIDSFGREPRHLQLLFLSDADKSSWLHEVTP